MGTLTAVFKTLMYPKPILLKYLPELLRLSLPGLDASDVAKTTVTLQLYSTVLTWLPVRSSYQAAGRESYPPLHVQLIDPSFVDYNPYSQDIAQVEPFSKSKNTCEITKLTFHHALFVCLFVCLLAFCKCSFFSWV